MTIKLAFKKDNPNLVFDIQEIERVNVAGGIVEYYSGDLIDTSTVPDTRKAFKAQVMAFESEWVEVPVDLGSTGDINNQDKTATPSNATQTIKPDRGYTGLSKVTINAAPLEAKEVTPSTTDQTVQATGTGKIGLSSVTVNAVTAAIDANIVAGNIKKDVEILGVTGSLESLETVTVTLNLPDWVLNTYLVADAQATAVKGRPYNNLIVCAIGETGGGFSTPITLTMGDTDITSTCLVSETIGDSTQVGIGTSKGLLFVFKINIPTVTDNIVLTGLDMINDVVTFDQIETTNLVVNQ